MFEEFLQFFFTVSSFILVRGVFFLGGGWQCEVNTPPPVSVKSIKFFWGAEPLRKNKKLSPPPHPLLVVKRTNCNSQNNSNIMQIFMNIVSGPQNRSKGSLIIQILFITYLFIISIFPSLILIYWHIWQVLNGEISGFRNLVVVRVGEIARKIVTLPTLSSQPGINRFQMERVKLKLRNRWTSDKDSSVGKLLQNLNILRK